LKYISVHHFRPVAPPLKVGALEWVVDKKNKIIIGSLESEKIIIGSLESEKSGPYKSIPAT